MELTSKRVSFRYRPAGPPALKDVDFRLTDGVTGLVGVNGAGKSTLLRVLARAEKPDHGAVTLDGEDLHAVPPRVIASRIGFMPQEFILPYGSRVLDSLRYLGWLKGMADREALQRSTELLEVLGLADRSRDRVSTLSGGMVRRVALAQALLTGPDVLLLDEPTTGLDPEQRVLVRELLAAPRLGARITLISSHVMEDVEALADRVLLLEAGGIEFDGGLTEFCTGPDGGVEDAESAFVRRLVGVRR